MAAVTVERNDQGIFIMDLCGGGANTFDEFNIGEFLTAMDDIEAAKGDGALVITSSNPKMFSAGINLDYIKEKGVPYIVKNFLPQLDTFLMRVAVANIPTIAAINGHAYGGGSLLASCCDFRYMVDGPKFCFPEVNIKLPFSPAMQQVIQLLPDRWALQHLALTGIEIKAPQAKEMRVIEEVCADQDELMAKAMEMATLLASKHRPTYTKIKRDLRPGAMAALADLKAQQA